MLDKNTIIKVTNRTRSSVGSRIEDMNLRRTFAPGETKEITYEELKKLSYKYGGQVILQDCLVLDNEAAVAELLGTVEPEYYYSPEKVKEVLLNGSYEAFLDCLDFAPDGVLNLIKDYAVRYNLNDIQKREAILKKTGFNVTKAIEINQLSATAEEEPTKTRRVAVDNNNATPASPVRRVTIVNK